MTYVALNPCICQLDTGVLKTRSGSRQSRAQIHHHLASCHGGYTLLSPSLHSDCVLSYSGISLPEVVSSCDLVQHGGPRVIRPIVTGPAWPLRITGLICKGISVITVCNPALWEYSGDNLGV
jgi:hypothetical protein